MLYLTSGSLNVTLQIFFTFPSLSHKFPSFCRWRVDQATLKLSRLESDAAFGALSSDHKFVEISNRFIPVISLPAGCYCEEYLHPRTPNNLYTDFIFRNIRMLTLFGLTRGHFVLRW